MIASKERDSLNHKDVEPIADEETAEQHGRWDHDVMNLQDTDCGTTFGTGDCSLKQKLFDHWMLLDLVKCG
jgi:hypothetical protein